MTPHARRWLPRLLAVTTAVVGVVVVVVVVVVVLDWSDPYAEPTEAATAFGVQMNTYDATQPQEFLDRVEPFLDEPYRDEFAALVTPLLADLARARQTSDRASVDGVDVPVLSENEARVEMRVSSRISQRGDPLRERLAQTWSADLIERDGRWLVAAFSFVGQSDGPTTET